MKWYVFILLILLPLRVDAREDLSIEEAIRSGMVRNRSLQIVALAAEAEAAKADEVDAQRLPGLSLAGSYNRLSEGTFRLSTTNLPQPIPVGNVVVDNFAFRVGLRQHLFTGFRLSSLSDAAQFTADAARGDQRMAEEDLVYGITAAYWSLYQARQMIRFSDENVRRLEQYLQDTRRLADAGMATRNDVLRIEVQQSRARITLIEAENSARVAEMWLNTVIGFPASTAVTLTSQPGSVVQSRPEAAMVEAMVDSALGSRPDLHAASLRAMAAEEMVDAAKGAWWPQFELTAHYNYSSPNQRYQPITPEFLGTWDVGVTMLFDLWNWGGTGSRVEQAEAAKKSAELRQARLNETIILEVNTAYFDLNRSVQKLEVSELAVEAAAENLRTMSEKHASGLATTSEILDAEIDLFLSQTEMSAAQVEYELSQAGFRKALGGAQVTAVSNE